MDCSVFIHGVTYPNRIFIGGLPKSYSLRADVIAHYFKEFGDVVETKIILNEKGVSKGYGFVTFSKREDVENVLAQGPLYFQGKKLNLGPAVRKQLQESVQEPVLLMPNNYTIPRRSINQRQNHQNKLNEGDFSQQMSQLSIIPLVVEPQQANPPPPAMLYPTTPYAPPTPCYVYPPQIQHQIEH